MVAERKNHSWGLLILDVWGALLFALGAIGQFGGGGSLLPAPWQFPGHNFLLISAGILLMLPYMVHVIRRGRPNADHS